MTACKSFLLFILRRAPGRLYDHTWTTIQEHTQTRPRTSNKRPGAYILQAGFPCLNALENGACVLRRLVAFLGRFVSYPYKVSRPYIQAARIPSGRVWQGFTIHYSDLTKPAFRAHISTYPENRPLFRSFSADFPIIFGFCYENIKRPAPCAFLRQNAGLCVIVGES